MPDPHRIIQWAGVRYQVSQTDKEWQESAQGRPRWRPNFGLVQDPNPPHSGPCLGSSHFISSNPWADGTRYAGIGSILAFCATPEFFAQHRWFPGLWVSGKPGTGKTTLVRFMHQLWSFDTDWENCLTGATLVGVRIVAQQEKECRERGRRRIGGLRR